MDAAARGKNKKLKNNRLKKVKRRKERKPVRGVTHWMLQFKIAICEIAGGAEE